MPLLSKVSCGTYLVYRPRGAQRVEQDSRRICYTLKDGNEELIDRVVAHIVEHDGASGVRDVLGTEAVLVPMPRSSPLKKGALWPAQLLAEALVGRRMGLIALPLLERTLAVRKSSTSPPGGRPTASDHFSSMEVNRLVLPECERLVVVDDVITQGATMIAAVSRLVDAYPKLSVSGFAFVRTMSFDQIHSVVEPACCNITLNPSGSTRRAP